MQALNRMTLRFDSKSINESFARMTVAAFVAQLDPTLEELNDIKTVVSEAVTNAIVHGYRDRVGEIVVAVRLLEDQIVEIKVKDHGCGISDISQARQPLFTTGDHERSGMGFTIMESFMTELKVSSQLGRGTTVHMKRKILKRGGKS